MAEPAPPVQKATSSEDPKLRAEEEVAQAQSKAATDRWLIALMAALAVAVVVLVLVTSGLIWFVWRHARDTRTSIAASKTFAEAALKFALVSEVALQSAEAPYLYPNVRAFSKEAGDPEAPGGGGVVSCTLHNHGRSPAIVREVYQSCLTSRGPPDPVPFPPPQANLGITDVIPAGEASVTKRFGPRSVKQAGDGTEPDAIVWLVGQVRYGDVFGNQFLTGFCFGLNRVSGAFVAYGGPGYNYRRKLTEGEGEAAEARDAF